MILENVTANFGLLNGSNSDSKNITTTMIIITYIQLFIIYILPIITFIIVLKVKSEIKKIKKELDNKNQVQ